MDSQHDDVVTRPLLLAEAWTHDPDTGLWTCGDLGIALNADDHTHYSVWQLGNPSNRLFGGHIPPSGMHLDDFAHFAGLLVYDSFGEFDIPTAGLELWFQHAQVLADDEYEQRAEAAALAELQKQGERLVEEEKQRALLGLVDLAEVMEGGGTEPELLTDLLVKGEMHYVYGMKESAKTWLALVQTRAVLEQGGTVVWVDKEMGRKNLADRLGALGIGAEVVRPRFVYCEYPTMDCSKESAALWAGLLDSRKPDLLVVDAQTEVLADAGLNENLGTDIERWAKAYITPARRVGCTVVMLDHTGHEEQGRAVGSRHKGAAAKVEWAVRCVKRFDRQTFGQIEVSLNKNTAAADIPEVVRYRIGGDSEGGFVFEETIPMPDADAKSQRFWEIRAAILEQLKRAGTDGLSMKQIEQLVTGATATKRDAVRSLADEDGSGVESRPKGNGVRFYWADPQSPESGESPSPLHSRGVETAASSPGPSATDGDFGDLAIRSGDAGTATDGDSGDSGDSGEEVAAGIPATEGESDGR